MFFMVHPEYRPKKPVKQFAARLYGFKIHPMAYQLQYQAAANSKQSTSGSGSNNTTTTAVTAMAGSVTASSATTRPMTKD